MGLTSSRLVTSGYFRNHAYVLLGLNVLATLVALANRSQFLLWPPLAGAILSYLSAAVWLYEKPQAGKVLLFAVAAVSLLGAWSGSALHLARFDIVSSPARQLLWYLDPMVGGLVLGSTMAAMFLGHWYLNTPTMELSPLRTLIVLMIFSVVVRSIVCGVGTSFQLAGHGFSTPDLLMDFLRWAAGIVGVAVLAIMAWQTLKIPNTQSATGILYVAVIATFIGELTAQLLSASTVYPL
ncbi:MAG: hypothetical protein IT427_13845 [Pirellulales bacterium]|nr:hypothetical protein [Pirellulales bacterium]